MSVITLVHVPVFLVDLSSKLVYKGEGVEIKVRRCAVALPNAVLFDLEGTVVDLEKYHFDAFVLAAQALGGSLTLEELIAEDFLVIGGGDKKVAEVMSRMLHVSPGHVLSSKVRFFTELREEQPAVMRPHVSELLDWLVRSGIPIGIASLTPRESAMKIVVESDLDTYFPLEHMLFLEDVGDGFKKPHPKVFLDLATRLGVDPVKCIGFEDSPTGVMALRAAHIKPLVVPPLDSFPESARALLLENLRQVGATEIFLGWDEVSPDLMCV